MRADFLAGLDFGLDPFQVQALDAIDAGQSVLVAAPTGSGKTVVAEYAVAKALAEGGKAFYTTPLKALSNQKYGDLVRRHGAAVVGLLTGDNAINGDAPVVVMTTEVLRNMLYAGSPAVGGLRYVVLDEVHYLQNEYRGPVWEEVIIHTAPDVRLVCLSATVSNAEEFSDWVQTVRGPTVAVIEERRPVTLHNLYLVGDRRTDSLLLMPTVVDGRPNPEAKELDRRAWQHGDGRRPRSRLFAPRRAEVVDLLAREDMLPAIYFIFSRAGCDEAVRRCVSDGIRLTTEEEREQIRAIVEAKVEALSDDDLRVLGYGEWLVSLQAGLAAHHAGMVPPFKEAVEACFAAALVKVVFATETLALGINMPARSVVIERLSKFTGERIDALTPGEYTQLTGRAGRRGIDQVGYGIVLWSQFKPFDQVADLVTTRIGPLTSAFRPTYNMAANLVRRYPPDEAHHLLNLSFAQYRTDRDVVRLEAQLERNRRLSDEAREAARCDRGDVEEYRKLLAAAPRLPRGDRDEAVVEAIDRLRPGDVVMLEGGKSGGRAAVLTTRSRRRGDVRLRVLTPSRRQLTLSPRDFSSPPTPVGHIELPHPFAPNNAAFQRSVAQSLAKARLRPGDGGGAGRRKRRGEDNGEARHPVEGCPDAKRHLDALRRVDRLAQESERLERRIRGRAESLARQFDRVLRVLEAWDYVDGWALTPHGERLRRIYHESDLLVAECVGDGLFDGLDPPEVAALASTFTYEARGPGPAIDPTFPPGPLRTRFRRAEELARQLNRVEEEAGLPLTRPPAPGFVAMAHDWAAGRHLGEIVGDDDAVTPGDFVRNVKQLIDLLRQLGEVAPEPPTASAARKAADALFRGVVAASSAVATGDE